MCKHIDGWVLPFKGSVEEYKGYRRVRYFFDIAIDILPSEKKKYFCRGTIVK